MTNANGQRPATPRAGHSDEGSPPSLSIAGAKACIHLNRPRQHNRFQREDLAHLATLLDEVERDRAVRVLMFTASGPSFSAGFDIGGFEAGGASQPHAFGDLCDRVEAVKIPTLCVLNGSVYGGATDFALACDIRIAVEGARMMMPPARLGIQYYYGGLRRYVERLGPAAAKLLILTGEPIDAQAMLRIGFVQELVAADALMARADALATACAERAPGALRGLKASLDALAQGKADPALIQARFDASLTSAEAQEGLRAWAEKRPPIFKDEVPAA
ncbi:enoyl-CoA hydratase/isomerase family protein [Roseixanthobacter pseudopolyaromaticivorans]|uniref:enoyl-CoA hydratase/isomerase family protein n=1 Tax=Xanthobacteraceae TaxID=335928 RepID=UPI00372CD636